MTVSRWTARRYFHCLRRTITRITDKSTVNVLQQSLASITQIYQSIFQIYRPEFASRRKLPGCVPDVRIEVSRAAAAAWSKHWRQCVWLTCPTPTRATLASRCSRSTTQKLLRCGAGARVKSTYCDLSSFGPALFEIWWPDIYLGGP